MAFSHEQYTEMLEILKVQTVQTITECRALLVLTANGMALIEDSGLLKSKMKLNLTSLEALCTLARVYCAPLDPRVLELKGKLEEAYLRLI